uniref:Uncharacterized protein n=1 Tax=Knipowitschia caucasica TaxID=637954 RepID=A0AAV2L7E8_KNICA
MDYQAEIEDQLRTNVQAPGQCLRDFAYDHRALCLKWRPDMTEADMLVKVGSLIEKDWSNTKDYWSSVQQSHPPKRVGKKNDHGPNRSSGGDVATALGEPSLLVVPVLPSRFQRRCGTRFGMHLLPHEHSLWKAIKKDGEILASSEIPKFVMANGQENKALGKATLLFCLHDFHGMLGVHVLADDNLCMPLLLGLDFMSMCQVTLKPHCRRYIMPGGKEYAFLPPKRLLRPKRRTLPVKSSGRLTAKQARVASNYQLQQDVWYRGVPSKYGGFNYQVVVPAALQVPRASRVGLHSHSAGACLPECYGVLARRSAPDPGVLLEKAGPSAKRPVEERPVEERPTEERPTEERPTEERSAVWETAP